MLREPCGWLKDTFGGGSARTEQAPIIAEFRARSAVCVDGKVDASTWSRFQRWTAFSATCGNIHADRHTTYQSPAPKSRLESSPARTGRELIRPRPRGLSFNTFQDRVVKVRLAGGSTRDAANQSCRLSGTTGALRWPHAGGRSASAPAARALDQILCRRLPASRAVIGPWHITASCTRSISRSRRRRSWSKTVWMGRCGSPITVDRSGITPSPRGPEDGMGSVFQRPVKPSATHPWQPVARTQNPDGDTTVNWTFLLWPKRTFLKWLDTLTPRC